MDEAEVSKDSPKGEVRGIGKGSLRTRWQRTKSSRCS